MSKIPDGPFEAAAMIGAMRVALAKLAAATALLESYRRGGCPHEATDAFKMMDTERQRRESAEVETARLRDELRVARQDAMRNMGERQRRESVERAWADLETELTEVKAALEETRALAKGREVCHERERTAHAETKVKLELLKQDYAGAVADRAGLSAALAVDEDEP